MVQTGNIAKDDGIDFSGLERVSFFGPLVGGTFATFGNWRMAFVVVAFQAAVFIGLALVVSPKLAQQEGAERPEIPFLRLGLICLSVLSVSFESVCRGGAAVIVAWIKMPSEARLIQLGTALLALSLMGFALVMDSGPIWLILVFAGMQGAGFGMMWAFIVRRITESAREKEKDKTASAIPTMQQIGFAFGSAATGIVANSSGFGKVVTVAAAQSAAFWIFAVFIPFALVACIAGWRLAK